MYSISFIKDKAESLSNTLDQAEERTLELEDGPLEISPQMKNKTFKKKKGPEEAGRKERRKRKERRLEHPRPSVHH